MGGKDTTLLRFNCFDFEKSYIYGPENTQLEVAGPGDARRWGPDEAFYRMDPTTDGNPIGWTIKTLATKLPKMLERGRLSADRRRDRSWRRCSDILPDLEASASGASMRRSATRSNPHRGTHLFEAGNIRFGLEMRRLPMGDGGLAIHVLADIGGTPSKASYTEETELLAFDHFWNGAHYHYGPAQQEPPHLLGPDPWWRIRLALWTLEQFSETGKVRAMIERAGYPGIAADLDTAKIAAVFPEMKKQALHMWAEGETG